MSRIKYEKEQELHTYKKKKEKSILKNNFILILFLKKGKEER